MSLLDKMKEAGDKASKSVASSYKEHQAKVEATKDARGKRLEALTLQYMGGYDDKKKAQGNLTFYEKQTEFSSPLSTKFVIPNSEIKDVAIEGKDEVNRRVTVTRLLAVGIFAFALKKKNKDKEAYLTLVLADGQEAIFFVDKKSPMELKTKLAKVISQVKQTDTTEEQSKNTTTQDNVADELAKLATLKEQGVLTQEEFEHKKKQLLGM